jgi:DNA-directed RNA polymerase subunit H (RpoH/RPB5)
MYLSYRVYKYLREFMKYRKLEIISKSSGENSDGDAIIGQKEFTQNIQFVGHVIIETKDADDKDRRYPKNMHPSTLKKPIKTIFVLLDRYSTSISSAQHFTQLLMKIPNIKSKEVDHNMDIIIIPYQTPGTNITNKLGEYTYLGDSKKGFIRFMMYEYSYFTSNKMKSINVVPSRIILREEEAGVLDEIKCSRPALSKAKISETVCVWLGAEIGDIIEEDIPSEASGISRNYRWVRP